MLKLDRIRITPAILRLVAEIDEFKGVWRGLQKHTDSLMSLDEVAGYGRALEEVLGPLREKKLSGALICKLHASLTPDGGAYRTDEYFLTVPGAERLETADPQDIEALTERLCDWTEEALLSQEWHPLLVIGVFAAIILSIAPFDKHNKRLCALLITLLMLKTGYHYAPYSALENALRFQDESYGRALKNISVSLMEGRPEWTPWLDFYLCVLREQKNALSDRLAQPRAKMSDLPPLSVKILGLFSPGEQLNMTDIERSLNEPRSTLKLRLKELVRDRYLTRHGKARATWYGLV